MPKTAAPQISPQKGKKPILGRFVARGVHGDKALGMHVAPLNTKHEEKAKKSLPAKHWPKVRSRTTERKQRGDSVIDQELSRLEGTDQAIDAALGGLEHQLDALLDLAQAQGREMRGC